ncbi:MAG: hypothetical protein HPY44_19540 [Armatimonadetes bacterium]|nr:hypothetical protein [Armatimonadota bacterium]
MSDRLTLLVSSLSGPPGSSGSQKALLPHRELPGWAVQHITGCIGDACLLLIADTLTADLTWSEPPWDPQHCFHDSPSLLGALSQAGRVKLFDGHTLCKEARPRLEAFIDRALGEHREWLAATNATAKDWEAQSDLIAGVWETTRDGLISWRDMLRGAGMSLLKHNYRNQTQAVTALLTLIDWQPAEAVDPDLLREAFSSELAYIGCMIIAASCTAGGVHDWSDLFALYRRLLPDADMEVLSFRMPGIAAAHAQAAIEILTGPAAEGPRSLLCAALSGGGPGASDIERALLAAVPRELRTPYIYRETSVHRFDPERLHASELPDPGPLFISRWRAAAE